LAKVSRLECRANGARLASTSWSVHSSKSVSEPGGIVALTAQAQQILVQALRQLEFSPVEVIPRLPIGHPKELRGGTQLLPELSCAGIGMAQFQRRLTFDAQLLPELSCAGIGMAQFQRRLTFDGSPRRA
jgi:hypothetical protein